MTKFDWILDESVLYTDVEHAVDQWFNKHKRNSNRVGLWYPDKKLCDEFPRELILEVKKQLHNHIDVIKKSKTCKTYEQFQKNYSLLDSVKFLYMIGNAKDIVYRPQLIQVGNTTTIHPGFARLIARTLNELDNSCIYMYYSNHRSQQDTIHFPKNIEYFTSGKQLLHAVSYTDHIPSVVFKGNRLQKDITNLNQIYYRLSSNTHEGLEWTIDLNNSKDWWNYYEQSFELITEIEKGCFDHILNLQDK